MHRLCLAVDTIERERKRTKRDVLSCIDPESTFCLAVARASKARRHLAAARQAFGAAAHQAQNTALGQCQAISKPPSPIKQRFRTRSNLPQSPMMHAHAELAAHDPGALCRRTRGPALYPPRYVQPETCHWLVFQNTERPLPPPRTQPPIIPHPANWPRGEGSGLTHPLDQDGGLGLNVGLHRSQR